MNTAHQAMEHKNTKRKSKKNVLIIGVIDNFFIYKTLLTNQCCYKNYINSLTYRNENDFLLNDMLLSIASRKMLVADNKHLLQNDVTILSKLHYTNQSSQNIFSGNICIVKDGTISSLIRTFEGSFSASNFIIMFCTRSKNLLNRNLKHSHMLGISSGRSISSSQSQLFNIITSIKIMIFDKYVEAKIAIHSVYRLWFFQNVIQGFMLNEILRKFSIYTFYVINENGFAIIKKIHRISLSFINTLPMFVTMMDMSLLDLNKTLNFPLLFDGKSLNFNVCAIIMDNKSYTLNKNKKQNYCNNLYNKKDCFTQCNDNEELLIDFGTNTEEDIFERKRYFSINKINFYNYFLQLQNSKLWMPNLCGAPYDERFGYLAYILKCSCLNESSLNLCEVEEFTWEMANLLTSLIFYKTIFKDLCKCVGSIFFSFTL